MKSAEQARICILVPDCRGGGAERVNLDLAHEFVRRGHIVELVLMRAEGEFLPEAIAAFPVFNLGVARSRQIPMALVAYLRKHRPDALLAAMWPLTVSAAAARLLSRQNYRLVLSEHGLLSHQYSEWGWWHRIMLRLSTMLGYRLANARVGVSEGVVLDMAFLASMDRSRFHAIHNPVLARSDPSHGVLAGIDDMWGVPTGRRILSVGTFKKVKNHALLLRAFALLQEPDHTRLMLLGQGEEEGAMRALARTLGIHERVIFAGFQADPTPFYRTADLFVLSSDHEGFGNVIVEALAEGTPVVSTDCPAGPREILADGQFGRLVPVGDVVALADAMANALAATVDREALMERARYFSVERSADEYLKLLLPEESTASGA